MSDNINPAHYTSHPSGIEVIGITEQLGFNLGNAWKYIARCDLKGRRDEDLHKAIWYLHREVDRLSWGRPVSYTGSAATWFMAGEPEQWKRQAFARIIEACRGTHGFGTKLLTQAAEIVADQIETSEAPA